MSKLRTVAFGPWIKGINNSARAYAVPSDAVLDALNVDITDEGHAIRRSGKSETVALDVAHSLATLGGKTLLCQGGTLGVVTAVRSLTITALRAGLGPERISYAERGGEVWWSNGTDSGRCNDDNTDHPWTTPAPANLVAVFPGVGALLAGTYRVAITHATTDGEESVASAIESVAIDAGEAIVLTLPAAVAGVTHFNIYCTQANGGPLQLYSTVVAATSSVTISTAPTGRQLRDRAFLAPLPAGEVIGFHGNRLLSIKGEWLFYSEPYDYGVYDPSGGYIRLGANGAILASVESGLFVVADRTWFYQGEDIKTAAPFEKLAFGAAAGTAFVHPVATSPVVGWYSDEGLAIGSSDGSIKMLQRDLGFIAPKADSGATWVRQRDGQAHVVVSLDATAAYDRQVSPDFTVSRMRYNDDATTMSINLTTGATARYGDLNLNSFATFEGEEYGCDSIGMHLLEGDTDAGIPIQAVIDLGHTGMGAQQIKSPICAYVSGKSSAPLIVTITLPDGTAYDYPARSYSEEVERVQRHDGMKGLMNKRQTWFDTVLRNDDDGCSMEVFFVVMSVNESARRI